ncbi:hypothetical protein [Phytoactinopolyspora endophytica]|uniref:hypothetical protein n=1 Tax=Phytoactinopolyspora endophytica TaxID=1642495 RepID=UPI00101BDC9E|nr:hypothetical protein [Phytoactinopolyspora endophytica]
MADDKRFITKKDDDGSWKVYDKQREEFMSSGVFANRNDAVSLAKIYEDHHQELMNKQAGDG